MKQTNLCSIVAALAGITTVEALHVTQWQDSMTILPGHYIELVNSNEQSLLSAAVDNKTNIQQDFSVDLVSEARGLLASVMDAEFDGG